MAPAVVQGRGTAQVPAEPRDPLVQGREVEATVAMAPAVVQGRGTAAAKVAAQPRDPAVHAGEVKAAAAGPRAAAGQVAAEARNPAVEVPEVEPVRTVKALGPAHGAAPRGAQVFVVAGQRSQIIDLAGAATRLPCRATTRSPEDGQQQRLGHTVLLLLQPVRGRAWQLARVERRLVEDLLVDAQHPRVAPFGPGEGCPVARQALPVRRQAEFIADELRLWVVRFGTAGQHGARPPCVHPSRDEVVQLCGGHPRLRAEVADHAVDVPRAELRGVQALRSNPVRPVGPRDPVPRSRHGSSLRFPPGRLVEEVLPAIELFALGLRLRRAFLRVGLRLRGALALCAPRLPVHDGRDGVARHPNERSTAGHKPIGDGAADASCGTIHVAGDVGRALVHATTPSTGASAGTLPRSVTAGASSE